MNLSKEAKDLRSEQQDGKDTQNVIHVDDDEEEDSISMKENDYVEPQSKDIDKHEGKESSNSKVILDVDMDFDGINVDRGYSDMDKYMKMDNMKGQEKLQAIAA
jgi:hypothetical protein